MGSYTNFEGHFTVNKVVDRELLTRIEKDAGFSVGFLKEKSAILKTDAMRKKFKNKYFKFHDEWKGLDEDYTLKAVQDLVASFIKHGVTVQSASMVCRHEYGNTWKVELFDNELTLSRGHVEYTPLKVVKVEVKEQVTKTTLVNFT